MRRKWLRRIPRRSVGRESFLLAERLLRLPRRNQGALINAVRELPDARGLIAEQQSSISSGVAAIWRISASPAVLSRALVFGPMPGNHLLGRG
jgi:hypothetical protein